MEYAIEVQNLSKEYPGKMAIKGLNFKISQNRIHGFLGPNGAGKSTTMNIISGLLKQSSGDVLIGKINSLEDPIQCKREIGFLPEVPPLYTDMKVEDFLFFQGMLYLDNPKEVQDNLNNVIKRMDLGSVRYRFIDQLSKGFKQRVGIASTLIMKPSILILDEPVVGLDPKSIIEVRDLIKELRDDYTIMLSSHQLGEVAQICDDITIINNGEIIESSSYSSIKERFDSHTKLGITIKSEKSLGGTLSAYGEIESSIQNGEFLDLHFRLNDSCDRSSLLEFLVQNNHQVFEFRKLESSLEDIFLKLVDGKNE